MDIICYNTSGDFMAIDGFLVKQLIDEFKNELLNLRVLKITQNRKDIIVFHFNKSGKKLYLNFKLNQPYASAFISNELNQNGEPIITGFVSDLKRLFNAAILSNVTQHLNDRVIIFDFTINDFLDGKIKRQLVFELMGRHNNLIILEDNVIFDAFNKNFSEHSRSVIPKLAFSFFPTNKRLADNINYGLVDHPHYLSKNYMGFSPLLSTYLYNNQIDLSKVVINPTYNKDSKEFYWFNLFNESDNIKSFESVSSILDYLAYSNTNDFIKQNNFVDNELVKQRKRRANLEKDLKKANNNLKLQELGNIIYASGKNLNEKHTHITDFNNNVIAIDSKYTLNENAQRAFTKYRKATRAIDHINKNINDTHTLEDQLLEIKFFLSLDNVNIDEINEELVNFGFKIKKPKQRKKQDELQLLKLTYLDTLIYIGKNNKQNDLITHKLSSRNDYWFHVENAPGSHVLVKSNNPSDEIISFAAMLAAKFSTLKDNGKVSVNYTQVRNLKKIPGKPGHMVILNTYKSLTISIDDALIDNVFIANKLK